VKKKKWTIVLAAVVAAVLLIPWGYIIVCTFVYTEATATFSEYVAEKYGIVLPDSAEEIYGYRKSGGIFSNGKADYYYVYRVEAEELSAVVRFTSVGQVGTGTAEAFGTHFGAVEADYALVSERDYAVATRRADEDFLYLIYDGELSRLIVMEIEL